MRLILATAAAMLAASVMAVAAIGQTLQQVRPYVRQDGRYVAPHMRTAPDGNPWNNLGAAPQPRTGNPFMDGFRPYPGTVPQPSPYASPWR